MNGLVSMLHKATCCVLFAMVLSTVCARAEDASTPTFSFNGFGTAGLVHSSEDQADFTSTILKPNGAGYSHTWSPDVDSLVGVQGTARLTPRITAVLQIISEQNYDKTYQPHAEWANIGYRFTPEFNIRVGRTVLPTFLYSGTRKVAYTYPWVRPPLEVYSWVPVTASDGVSADYLTHVGDFTHTVNAIYGKSKSSLPQGGTIKAEQALGITYTVEYHAVTMHLAYQRPKQLTVDSSQPLFDAFRQFGPQGNALADRYDADKKPFSIFAAGAMYDPGSWFVTSEFVHTESHSFLGAGTGWYVSGGHRFRGFTPYITYAHATADNLSDPGLDLTTLPPSQVGTAAALNATLNGMLSAKTVQNTISVGGRWELTRSVALKLQYDHTDIGAGSTGLFFNLQPGFQTGSKINLISTTIDFVF